jgi:putative membrane protein
MSVQVQAFANGFPTALLHALVALLILAVAGALHGLLSPAGEVGQIREGNPAAAVAFGGVLLALSGPVAVALLSSTSLPELGLWGGAAALTALILFRLIDALFAGLPQRVQEGEVSAAVLLVAAKTGAALILSAAIAG